MINCPHILRAQPDGGAPMTQKVDPFELSEDLDEAIHAEKSDLPKQADSPSQTASAATDTPTNTPPPPADSDPLDTAGDNHPAMSKFFPYNRNGRPGAI